MRNQHASSDDEELTQMIRAVLEAGARCGQPTEHDGDPASPSQRVINVIVLAQEPGDTDDEKEQEAYQYVDGAVLTQEQEEDHATIPLTEAAPASAQHPPAKRAPAGSMLLATCLGALLTGALASVLLGLIAPTATITLIPVSAPISTSSTVTVLTTTAGGMPVDTGKGHLRGRALSAMTISQARTVPTSGLGHQEAQAARGLLTFYNAAFFPQVIPAGTLLVGADGVQVVTEQQAPIPAGDGSSNGAVTIPAHALQAGPAGNIAADDITGPCCRADVLVMNHTAFTGGHPARSFPMVSQHDLDQASTMLATTLQQSMQGAFGAQVHPDETLLTPVPCTSHVSSDHRVGEEAQQVTVTLTATCQGVAYQTEVLRRLVQEQQEQEAFTRLGPGYHLLAGTGPSMTVNATPGATPATFALRVRATGTWAYQFSEGDLEQFKHLIAGKSRAQASMLLAQQPGVSQVAISISGPLERETLPSDPARLHFLVLTQPATLEGTGGSQP